MRVANLFVKRLENKGVRYVLGIPGEENDDILLAPSESSIQFVPTCHERRPRREYADHRPVRVETHRETRWPQ